MGSTKIEWVDKVWNPVTGCTKISPGCQNCYAERMAKRLRGRCGYPADDPFKVTLHPDRLDQPLHWKKPSKIFVCSMGDLFHLNIRYKWLSKLWKIMSACQEHVFIILTKRPERMLTFVDEYKAEMNFYNEQHSNLWLGVTAENQEQADKRIPILLQIQATVRFVSIEPMLGTINLDNYLYKYFCVACGWKGKKPHTEVVSNGVKRIDCHYCPECNTAIEGDGNVIKQPTLDWVIVGGETGPKARPMHPDWARSVRDQCVAARVPFWFKQWGEWRPGAYYYGKTLKPGSCFIDKNNGNKIFLAGNRFLCKVGKKVAGNLLDGKVWNQVTEGRNGN